MLIRSAPRKVEKLVRQLTNPIGCPCRRAINENAPGNCISRVISVSRLASGNGAPLPIGCKA
jgi:hypothetical protein